MAHYINGCHKRYECHKGKKLSIYRLETWMMTSRDRGRGASARHPGDIGPSMNHLGGQGFDLTSARKFRLYHQCWIEFLDKWVERTKDAILLPWADGVIRLNRIFIGGVLGDQQEGDKYTGEPCVCHSCFAPRKCYLES